MIHIVSGPSCAGKSYFISNKQAARHFALPIETPVVLASSLSSGSFSAAPNWLFHYNILRPLDQALTVNARPLSPAVGFAQDAPWQRIRGMGHAMKAVVLVTTRAELEKRINSRHWSEPEMLGAQMTRYPRKRWLDILHAVDLASWYQQWCRELHSLGVDFELVDSNSSEYIPLSPEDVHAKLQIK